MYKESSININDTPYIPILKWKRGEHRALINLEDSIKNRIIPCIEIRTESEHTALHSTLTNYWNLTAIADYASPNGMVLGWRTDGYRLTLEKIKNNELVLYPALNPFDHNLLNNPTILSLLQDMKTIILRVRLVGNITNTEVAEELNKVRNLIKPERKNFVVILDCNDISEAFSNELIDSVKNLIQNLNNIGFQTIYLAAGSYPIQTSVGQSRIPRHDRHLWEAVSSKLEGLSLGYGDYTVVSPLWEETPGIRRGKATIRYTLCSDWLILKGNDSTKNESIRLSKLLLNLFKNDFKGELYSYGDKLIADRANSSLTLAEKKGGNETHLLEGVNHHISLVIKEHF